MLIKFILNKLLGIYPVASEEAKQLSLALVGQILLEKVSMIHPEIKEMNVEQKTNYLTNEWLKEETTKMMKGKQNKYLKLQDKLQVITQQLLNL